MADSTLGQGIPVGSRQKAVGSIFLLLTAYCFLPSALAATALIDDFEDQTANKVGGRSSTYVMAPSRALAVKVTEGAHGGAKALMIKYDKKALGGPYDGGGWCGYYTLVKAGPRFFDSTMYQALTFWVKGEKGEENLMVGLADKHWDEVGDSVKSEPIGIYLSSGKLTTEWQKATIPLSAFMLERKELASIVICFEGSLFPGGAGKGTVFIDDVVFE
jgi:hypothetical protein